MSRCIEEQENIPSLANSVWNAFANGTLLPSEPTTPPPKRRRLWANNGIQEAGVLSDDCHANTPGSVQPAVPRCCARQQTNAERFHATFRQDVWDGCEVVGRDEELGKLEHFLQGCLGSDGQGGHLYVSGSSGTGKTLVVRKAVSAWIKQHPTCKRLEVNCIDLAQRSLTGLLMRLWDLCGLRERAPVRLGSDSFAAALGQRLLQLGTTVVVIVDEVDQIVRSPTAVRDAGEPGDDGDAGDTGFSLETLFSLPHMSGAPSVALIVIANAVGLLERTAASATSLPGDKPDSLLFKPYTADQLRDIARARLRAAGCSVSPEVIIGQACLELGLRQIAKTSGDYREVLPLVEQALMEVNKASLNRL